ncbi:MAG: head GIN domain-containing protein [Janthinobacterium lividum]
MKLFSSLLPALLLTSAATVRPAAPAAAPAPAAQEVRDVPSFTKVNLATSVAVEVQQGSPQRVVVEGAPDDLAELQTTVDDGRLIIDTKSGTDWKAFLRNHHNLGKMTVRITMPTINALAVSSSGSLKAFGVRAENLVLGVSSSGSVTVEQVQATNVRAAVSSSGRIAVGQLQAAELHSALSSSGSITVGGGTCPRHEVAISGSGSVTALGLQSATCEARISSSGSCRVQATETLDARISGSGEVFVTGNPKITSRTSGSGGVRRG